MSKINKALDYNKLLEQQAEGKLLKKILKFPLYASIKYDGNYITARKENGRTTYTTSGGLTYSHTDDGAAFFRDVADGVYLAERIWGKGKLGDRDRCNLKGPKSAQTSTGHNYKVFDRLSLAEYDRGYSDLSFSSRNLGSIPIESTAVAILIKDQEELDAYLKHVVNRGYEGLMLMQPDWKWTDTKSRKIDFCKLKSRRTADLLCIETTEGEGKYEGLIGSLLLTDSEGREVSVGSGLSDEQRNYPPTYFVGMVIEIEFERIADTYIQPTIVRERHDKEDID